MRAKGNNGALLGAGVGCPRRAGIGALHGDNSRKCPTLSVRELEGAGVGI